MAVKTEQLYSGKAKTLYHTDTEGVLVAEFRDDTTAFNAEKMAKFANKGKVNNYFNAFMMEQLQTADIPTHFLEIISDTESLVKHLTMIPVECVVRNLATGGLCRRLGTEEGIDLDPPIFEFFLKDDALGDPMINEYHILTFGWANQQQIDLMKELTFKVNEVYKPIFAKAGLILVDYKLEFGMADGKMYLGDEFTPDGCRIWDAETRQKFDKDIFRKDLGDLVEGYTAVARRLGIEIPA